MWIKYLQKKHKLNKMPSKREIIRIEFNVGAVKIQCIIFVIVHEATAIYSCDENFYVSGYFVQDSKRVFHKQMKLAISASEVFPHKNKKHQQQNVTSCED